MNDLASLRTLQESGLCFSMSPDKVEKISSSEKKVEINEVLEAPCYVVDS